MNARASERERVFKKIRVNGDRHDLLNQRVVVHPGVLRPIDLPLVPSGG